MTGVEHSASEKVAAPEPQSLDAGTSYVVFVREQTELSDDKALGTGPGTRSTKTVWRQVAVANARSADVALKTAVGKLPESDRDGTFVAVPARYWKPLPISEKVERTLVIGS